MENIILIIGAIGSMADMVYFDFTDKLWMGEKIRRYVVTVKSSAIG